MWIILFVLPDLCVSKSIGDENIAIVPHDDFRIMEIVKQSLYAKAFVENFEDQFGRQHYPSFLISREGAPSHVKDIDVLVGFRNIVALTTIIKGHEHSLKNTFMSFPLYSDYFDFYPITISKDDDGFLTQSPSILGFDDEQNNFTGQISPGLASPGHLTSDCSGHLFDLLQKVWQKHYLEKKLTKWPSRALFRSFEMAYQASAMPFKNHSTIYDYGASASLWVSAFEILSHPQKGNANLQTVLNLIEKYDWIHKDLKRRAYAIDYRGEKRRVNLSQKLYKELYDTRNAFLHGNPVKPNRLKPFKNKNAQPITRFAPLLYKVALLNYLAQFRDSRIKSNSRKEYMQRLFNERDLSVGLLKAREPDPKR